MTSGWVCQLSGDSQSLESTPLAPDSIVARIQREALTHWSTTLTSFADWATAAHGAHKESGHALATPIEEATVKALSRSFDVYLSKDKGDLVVSRSMGDCWIKDAGVYYPFNVKGGIEGVSGQPNMVSLNRLIQALLRREIDAYYILMVRLRLQAPRSVTVQVFDLLDYLDYVAFNSGTGQTMLKQDKIYAAFRAGVRPPKLTVQQKVDRLFVMREAGDLSLATIRDEKREAIRREIQKYAQVAGHALDQQGLRLGKG